MKNYNPHAIHEALRHPMPTRTKPKYKRPPVSVPFGRLMLQQLKDLKLGVHFLTQPNKACVMRVELLQPALRHTLNLLLQGLPQASPGS